jgi:hypothetical protein
MLNKNTLPHCISCIQWHLGVAEGPNWQNLAFFGNLSSQAYARCDICTVLCVSHREKCDTQV